MFGFSLCREGSMEVVGGTVLLLSGKLVLESLHCREGWANGDMGMVCRFCVRSRSGAGDTHITIGKQLGGTLRPFEPPWKFASRAMEICIGHWMNESDRTSQGCTTPQWRQTTYVDLGFLSSREGYHSL